jgi:hypothetical protein
VTWRKVEVRRGTEGFLAVVPKPPAGAALAAGAGESVRATAEGNPLFIEQCLAGLAETADAHAIPDLPHQIRALIAGRLDRLSPAV